MSGFAVLQPPTQMEDRSDVDMNLEEETIDPECVDLTLDNIAKLRPDIPDHIMKALKNQKIFGPPVALLAGFRLEELAVVRMVIDAAGGQSIKVVPVTNDMLQMKVSEAVHTAEPEWERPRPDNFTQ